MPFGVVAGRGDAESPGAGYGVWHATRKSGSAQMAAAERRCRFIDFVVGDSWLCEAGRNPRLAAASDYRKG
jgi:hypothetical protein